MGPKPAERISKRVIRQQPTNLLYTKQVANRSTHNKLTKTTSISWMLFKANLVNLHICIC